MQALCNLELGTTVATKKDDPDPDLSYIGEYGDVPKPGCIIIRDGRFYEDVIDDPDYEWPERTLYYRYFYPAENGETIGSPDYRKYALQDFKEMEDYNRGIWHTVGITVSVTIHGKIPGREKGFLSREISHSVWGVYEKYSMVADPSHGEIISDLLYELKHDLESIGFEEEEINRSFSELKEAWGIS